MTTRESGNLREDARSLSQTVDDIALVFTNGQKRSGRYWMPAYR